MASEAEALRPTLFGLLLPAVATLANTGRRGHRPATRTSCARPERCLSLLVAWWTSGRNGGICGPRPRCVHHLTRCCQHRRRTVVVKRERLRYVIAGATAVLTEPVVEFCEVVE